MSGGVWVQERHGTAIEVLDRMLEIDILTAEAATCRPLPGR